MIYQLDTHLPSLGVSCLLGGKLLLACESNAENPDMMLNHHNVRDQSYFPINRINVRDLGGMCRHTAVKSSKYKMHHTEKVNGTYFRRLQPEGVAISGLDVAVGLDQRLPLLHHGPQLVSGQAHAVEVGQAVLTLKQKDS